MLTSLPNLLTISRIAAIPVLVILFFFDGALMRWLAFLVYAFACITDYFDGYFARHWGQVSALGRFLDPIADKLLVAALIVLLVAFDHVTGFVVVPALVILCREILVSGLREYLAEIQVPMPVSRLAKWKTGIQMVALGILIIGNTGTRALPIQLVGEIGIWIAAGLTFVTGYDYLARGLKHMTPKAPAGR